MVSAFTPTGLNLMPHHSRVLIIYTGGTIGMIVNPVTKAHEPFNFEHLASHVPELIQVDVEVKTVQFSEPIDSSNMHPDHWAQLARLVEQNYDDFDGFVILHGTDTMAYTASALSYMLQHLAKPVILTGSQLPIGILRTDGKENLLTAIEIAAARDRIGQPMVPEVCIYFQGSLLRGNRSKKYSAEQFHAFHSPNYPELAHIGVHISYAHHHILPVPASSSPLEVHYKFSNEVVAFRLFPGISESILESVLGIPGLRGVVIETYGAGNAMTTPWFHRLLRHTVDRGVVVVNVTQCIGGAVEMSIYDTGTQLSRSGVIGSGDMTTEATITKLMFLLGEGHSQQEVIDLMPVPIAGEISRG